MLYDEIILTNTPRAFAIAIIQKNTFPHTLALFTGSHRSTIVGFISTFNTLGDSKMCNSLKRNVRTDEILKHHK